MRLSSLCILWFLLFSCISVSAFSQEEYIALEELVENEEELQEAEDRINYLEGLLYQPVDLNTDSKDSLAQLPGITELTADKIIRYRQKHGSFINEEEVEKIPGISPSVLQRIKGFFSIGKKRERKKPVLLFRSRVQRQIQTSRGVDENIYQGSFLKQYSRLIWRSSKYLEGSFVQEKDAGEKRWTDYYSGYVLLRNLPFNHTLIAGDYLMEAGQGLLLWGGRWFGYGNDGVYSTKRRPRGIRGNRSSMEYGMFQGMALEGIQSGLFYQLFSGWNKWDSNQNRNGDVTSLYISGLHRTVLEQSKRNNLKEDVLGVNTGYTSDKYGRFGITYIVSDFDRSFVASERDRFRFQVRHNEAFALNGDFLWKSLNIFGEAARSSSGGTAGTAGAILNWGTSEFVAHVRRYDRDFHSFHGSGFGRRSTENRNENGTYLGGNIDITKSIGVSFYHDRYQYPWRTYWIPFSVRGKESMILFRYSKSAKSAISVRYKRRSQGERLSVFDSEGRRWDKAGTEKRHQVRLTWRRVFSNRFRLMNRIEGVVLRHEPKGNIVNFNISSGRGILLYQDLRIQGKQYGRLYLRYGVFLSKDAPVEFYPIRRDFPGTFSTLYLQGNGYIGTVLYTYHLTKAFDFSFRYSFIRYSGRSSIGSGYDLIQGSLKSYGGMQIDVKL